MNYIIFETTSKCNLDCLFCYNYWKRKDGQYPEMDDFKSSEKTLKKLFSISNVKHISFSGGEPFSADRFSELVLLCRMKKKTVSIISNGTVSSINELRFMVDIGVNAFQFPVHSIKSEIHDKLTQRKGSLEKTLTSLREVLKIGGAVVPVIVITKLNLHTIWDTLTFLLNEGINRVMVNRFNIGGRGIANTATLLPTKDELNHVFQKINKFVEKNKMVITSNVCTPFCILNPVDFPNISFTTCSLDEENLPLTIDIYGNIRYCNHSPKMIGNIFNESIEEMLSNPELLVKFHSTPDLCKECGLFDDCKGGCRAASEQIGLSLENVDPLLTTCINPALL